MRGSLRSTQTDKHSRRTQATNNTRNRFGTKNYVLTKIAMGEQETCLHEVDLITLILHPLIISALVLSYCQNYSFIEKSILTFIDYPVVLQYNLNLTTSGRNGHLNTAIQCL